MKYEDDPNRGKDRPVLVVGRDGRTLLGLMLSSQSERDGQRNWLALGAGTWDREGRPSWIRLDRVLEVDEDGIRREGAILDQARFDRVAAVLRRTTDGPNRTSSSAPVDSVGDMSGDAMVGFGGKQAWLAVRDGEPSALLAALGLRDLGEVPWRDAMRTRAVSC